MKEYEVRMEPLAIGVAETARILNISKPKVYQLIEQEGFPAFRCGGRRLISVEGLREWIRKQTETTTA